MCGQCFNFNIIRGTIIKIINTRMPSSTQAMRIGIKAHTHVVRILTIVVKTTPRRIRNGMTSVPNIYLNGIIRNPRSRIQHHKTLIDQIEKIIDSSNFY